MPATVKITPCFCLENKKIAVNQSKTHALLSSDPVEMAQKLSATGASEIAFIDIDSLRDRFAIWSGIIHKMIEASTAPVAFGNTMNTVEDFEEMLRTGVSRIIIDVTGNTDPSIIDILGRNYGAERIIVGLTARKNPLGSGLPKYEIVHRKNLASTEIDLVEWVKMAQMLGAGSLMINSSDTAGTGTGFDIELLQAVTSAVSIPVLASGGAGELEHFYQVVEQAGVAGVCASGVFARGLISPEQVRGYLQAKGIKAV